MMGKEPNLDIEIEGQLVILKKQSVVKNGICT